MAIIRKVNNEGVVFGEKAIISHTQLQDREAYGSHPISAIRKLPEKLTEIKTKLVDLQSQIDNIDISGGADVEQISRELQALQEKINNVESNAQLINLVEDNGLLTFTNYNNESESFRSGNEVDDVSITLNSEDKISLKAVAVDNTSIKGTGTLEDPLSLVNSVDNTTLKIKDDIIYANAIKTEENKVLTAESLDETLNNIDLSIQDFENRLANIVTENTTQNNKLYDLFTRTKGIGGYLNSHDFGKATPTAQELNTYAIQDIGTITQASEIFNGTKVINLYNKHLFMLTNTPDSSPAVFSWQDLGVSQEIALANNNGVHGLVTGSYENLEGYIDLDGHITINGLSESLQDITDIQEANFETLSLGKVDKVSSARKLYGTDHNGAPTTYTINYANDAAVNGVPTRAANGAIMITDASCEDNGSGAIADGLQAINKNYVKKMVSNLLTEADLEKYLPTITRLI